MGFSVEEKGGDVRMVFCPSSDLFHSTLPSELKGYAVGTGKYARLFRAGQRLLVRGNVCETETRQKERGQECLEAGADPKHA